jgi:hypothetical protein
MKLTEGDSADGGGETAGVAGGGEVKFRVEFNLSHELASDIK